ncbi:hypothetical protein ACIA8O_35025 [Kitasatospora sp. NPDC051853]|uniref:hypothetical protein n=1 Tax=Kitasatospora sp. NPDC051853 TaxID=3364058 RepID=UPI00379F8E7D
MTKQTPMNQLPYPEPSDIADIPLHLQALAVAADSRMVMRFDNATARDAAVVQPVAGMIAWLKSPGIHTIYSGTGWAQDHSLNPPRLITKQSADQSLPNGGVLYLNWAASPTTDSHGGFDPAQPTRYTPKVAGHYLVTAQVSFGLNSNGGRVINLIKNGDGAQNFGQVAAAAIAGTAYYTTLCATGMTYFNGTTDYYEVQVAQNSGATLTTVGGSTITRALRVF